MKKLLYLFLLVLLVTPMLVTAIDEPYSEDTSWDFDRVIADKDGTFVEISFNDEGTGVYLSFECNVTVRMSILNSTGRDAALHGEDWQSVNGMDLVNTNASIHFILPYYDTFYIMFYNPSIYDANLIGWYAADKTGPTIEYSGISNGDHFDYKAEVEVECYFTENIWNITRVEILNEFGYTLDSENVNALTYNWSALIRMTYFQEDDISIKFRSIDALDNVREITINVVLIGRPTTPVTPSDPPIGLFITIFGLIGLTGGVAGLRYLYDYKKHGEESVKPKSSGKKGKKKQR